MFEKKTSHMILLTKEVAVDIKIDFMRKIIEDSTILITTTILSAILDFSLIAGVWNGYPRYCYIHVI